MKRLVSGLLAISLIICFSVTVSAENRSFNDLSKSHWAYNDIMRLVNEGIIQGYDDGTVHPDRPIKRLEAAVLLCKAFNLEVDEEIWHSSFGDVREDVWYALYVHATMSFIPYSVKKGTLNGNAIEGKMFYPESNMTREDMAVAIVKLKQIFNGDVEGYVVPSYLDRAYNDGQYTSFYAKIFLTIAVQCKYITGFGDGTIRPKDPVTRAQFAVILNRVRDNPLDTKIRKYVDVTDEENSLVNMSSGPLDLSKQRQAEAMRIVSENSRKYNPGYDEALENSEVSVGHKDSSKYVEKLETKIAQRIATLQQGTDYTYTFDINNNVLVKFNVKTQKREEYITIHGFEFDTVTAYEDAFYASEGRIIYKVFLNGGSIKYLNLDDFVIDKPITKLTKIRFLENENVLIEGNGYIAQLQLK